MKITKGTSYWLALAFAAVAGCGKKHESAQSPAGPNLPAIEVRVQTAEGKPHTAFEEAVGTVRARLRATLEAKVSGRIAEMPVALGQTVRTGQLVARLDVAEIRARFEQAQASLEQAERDWKRASSLYDGQAMTRAELDAADARLRVARAAVAETQAMSGYAEVKAPFDGVITRKLADVGDLAAPGKPLVDIEDPAALQVEADLSEGIAANVKAGDRLAIQAERVSSPLFGTVSEMAPAADPVSRTFKIKVLLEQGSGLRLGQFARVRVPLSEEVSLRLPRSAIVRRGQLELAFVVADDRASLHLVKTGRVLGDEVEILAGLDAGDSVVVENAARLVDGQPVTLK